MGAIMTYQLLLVLEKPDIKDNKEQAIWNGGLIELAALAKQNADIQLLAESTLLLRLDRGLRGVCDVLGCISSRGLKYTYTILTEDTKWYGAIKTV
jgi:hypothetical protein